MAIALIWKKLFKTSPLSNLLLIFAGGMLQITVFHIINSNLILHSFHEFNNISTLII